MLILYYGSLDIAPFLRKGDNEVHFEVLRYFAASRSAMPFERMTHAGLTVVGSEEMERVSRAYDTSSYGLAGAGG